MEEASDVAKESAERNACVENSAREKSEIESAVCERKEEKRFEIN